MDIDINEIGRNGYKLLQSNGVVPEKEVKELSIKERKELVAKIESMCADVLYRKVTEKNENRFENIHKYNFLIFLYSSIITYLENTDLNKFINIKPKN